MVAVATRVAAATTAAAAAAAAAAQPTMPHAAGFLQHFLYREKTRGCGVVSEGGDTPATV